MLLAWQHHSFGLHNIRIIGVGHISPTCLVLLQLLPGLILRIRRMGGGISAQGSVPPLVFRLTFHSYN